MRFWLMMGLLLGMFILAGCGEEEKNDPTKRPLALPDEAKTVLDTTLADLGVADYTIEAIEYVVPDNMQSPYYCVLIAPAPADGYPRYRVVDGISGEWLVFPYDDSGEYGAAVQTWNGLCDIAPTE